MGDDCRFESHNRLICSDRPGDVRRGLEETRIVASVAGLEPGCRTNRHAAHSRPLEKGISLSYSPSDTQLILASMKKEVLALVLGGGQGSRLFPLTNQRSKPAVPLGGKYRLIDITVSNCINSNINNIFVLTQFNSASLNRHISPTYRVSQFSDGFVEILAAEQTPENRNWFQGTADAVRQVMMHISEFQPDHVLILSGDHLYQMDYRLFIKHHEDTGASVTLSVCPTDAARATGFGLLKTDDEGHVTEFREKPPRDQVEEMRVNTASLGLKHDADQLAYLASMGVYIFKFETLRDMLREGKHTDFGGEVIPAAIKDQKV